MIRGDLQKFHSLQRDFLSKRRSASATTRTRKQQDVVSDRLAMNKTCTRRNCKRSHVIKKLNLKVEDRLLLAQSAILNQVITPIVSPEANQDINYMDIFGSFAEEQETKVRQLEKKQNIAKRYEYEEHRDGIQTELQEAQTKKNQFEMFIHSNKNQIVNDFSIPLRALNKEMDVQELIQRLDKYISLNIEKATQKFQKNLTEHLKQQQKTDDALNPKDIRKGFYEKLNLKSKYKFLKTKIKDYIFYTNFLSHRPSSGSQYWKYTGYLSDPIARRRSSCSTAMTTQDYVSNNPLKTKDYLAALANAKYSAKIDLEDIRQYSDEFQTMVINEVQKYQKFTQEASKKSIQMGKKRASSAKSKWKWLSKSTNKLKLSFIGAAYKRRTDRKKNLANDIRKCQTARQNWKNYSKWEDKEMCDNLFDPKIYDEMYNSLEWDEEKERKWKACKVQKQIEIGKLDTYDKANTVATKSFCQTEFIRPKEIKIVKGYREEKNCFFFLNLPKQNLRRIQEKINKINEEDFDKIEQTIANNVLAKFKRNQQEINKKRIGYLKRRTREVRKRYDQVIAQKQRDRQIAQGRKSQKIKLERMKSFVRTLKADSKVPLRQKKLSSKFTLKSAFFKRIRHKCCSMGALNNTANQYKKVKAFYYKKQNPHLFMDKKIKKENPDPRDLEDKGKKIEYYKKAESKTRQFKRHYTGGPQTRGFIDRNTFSKKAMQLEDNILMQLCKTTKPTEVQMRAIVLIQAFCRKWFHTKRCQARLKRQKENRQRERKREQYLKRKEERIQRKRARSMSKL